MKNYIQEFVISSRGGGKFFEISVRDSTLTLRDGKLGSKGTTKTIVFDDILSAHARAQQLISDKVKVGYIAYPKKPLNDTIEFFENKKSSKQKITNIKYPLKFLQLQELFELIVEGVNEAYREDLRSAYDQRFKSGAWAWDPIAKPVPYNKIDRLGEVIMGPVYTCNEYEWPESDGYPMAPLIQLDLNKSGIIGGVDLGDGMLQVWMPHNAIAPEDQLVRVIPKEFVKFENITPILSIPKEMKPLQMREDVWDDEAADLAEAPAYQITGYAKKRFTIQLKHTIQDNFKINNLTSDKVLEARIKKFDESLTSLMKEGRKGCLPSNWHLFGTFYDIQYTAEQRPVPLFCFDGEEFGCNWVDRSAQLFYYVKADGRVLFSFDWSCF